MDENSSPSTKVASNTADNEFQVTGKLKEKTTYYWKVKAKNKYGKEKESNTFSFTTGVDLERILVSGPWNWYQINAKNISDVCVIQSTHEFKADGTLLIIEYPEGKGGKCPLSPIEKEYTYKILSTNKIAVKEKSSNANEKEYTVDSFSITGRGRSITIPHFDDPDKIIGFDLKRGME